MKAQAQQILIYALILVVVSLILLYGYNAIRTINDNARKAELIILKKDLTAKISSLSYGSVEIVTIRIPAPYTEACFAGTNALGSSAINNYPLVNYSIMTGAVENFFLEPRGDSFNIGAIEVQDGFFCAKAVRSSIKFRLEGKGNKVLVSPG